MWRGWQEGEGERMDYSLLNSEDQHPPHPTREIPRTLNMDFFFNPENDKMR